MVRTVTSLGTSGLSDWLIQRITALIMTFYLIFLVVYFAINAVPDFYQWQMLMSNNWMRLFTFLFFISLGMHAWIGMWIVSTDYIKPVAIRIIFQILVILTLLSCIVWMIEILWGL